MASGYVITVILARTLGPAAYGTYGVVMSMLLWFEVLSGFGLPRAAARLIPESKDPDAVIQATLAMLLTAGCVLFVACWLCAPAIAELFEIENGAKYFRLAVIDLPFNGLYIAYQGMLMGQRRFAVFSAMFVVYSLTKVGGILVLLVIGLSIEAALIVNVLATVGALLYIFAKAPVRLAFPDRKLLRSMLRIAAPLAVFVVTMQFVLSAHLWILQRVSSVSAETIGFYVAALSIAQLPSIVPAALTSVLLSSVALAFAKNDFSLAQRYVVGAGRFVIVVLAPVCVLGGLHATPLMSLIFSDAYIEGGPFLSILLVGFGLFALLDTLLHALIGADRHNLASATMLALTPVTLLACIGLIFLWGPMGAATAFVTVLALGVIVAVIWTYRRFQIFPVKFGTLLRVTVAIAITSVLGMKINMVGIWVLLELAVLTLIYLLILAALRELRPEDLKPFAIWKK